MDESNTNPPPSVDHETENVHHQSKNVDAVEEDMDESVKLKKSFSNKKIDKSTTSDC